eukprot:UN16477
MSQKGLLRAWTTKLFRRIDSDHSGTIEFHEIETPIRSQNSDLAALRQQFGIGYGLKRAEKLNWMIF